MKLLWVEEIDLVSLGKISSTKVFSACVSISDIFDFNVVDANAES
jgi:hypothetical protein